MNLFSTSTVRKYWERFPVSLRLIIKARLWTAIGAGGVLYLSPIIFNSLGFSAERIGSGITTAAIAGIAASDMYGIDVIAENIQDIHGNTTRFLVIGHNYGDSSGNDKTSLVLGVKHEAGALYRILSVFKSGNINLSKIESRPSRNQAWEYYFFVDLDGHVDDKSLIKVIENLKKECITLTILGSYPKVKN